MTSLETLAANLRHAARTGKPASIGGGEFSPAECEALADAIRQILNTGPDAIAAAVVGVCDEWKPHRGKQAREYNAAIVRHILKG